MVLEAYSVSHGKASLYLLVIELLREYFRIGNDDDHRKRRERILGKVLGLDLTLEDALPYFYSLYGIADAGDSLVQMDPSININRMTATTHHRRATDLSYAWLVFSGGADAMPRWPQMLPV